MKKLVSFHFSLSATRYLFALSLLLAASAFTAIPAKAQTWMVSTTAYVKLGVLDKYNLLGGYTATFIVKGERDGQEYILEKTVLKDAGGIDVLFPSEPTDAEYFKNPKGLAAMPTPGRYTWQCLVKGKRAVGGHFNYPETGNDITVITK